MKWPQWISSTKILVLVVSFSIIIGSSYNTYLSCDRFYNADSETYLHIAKGDFNDQSLIRKYRIVVPALAALVSYPISMVYDKIVQDKRTVYDWPLLTGFYLVNSFLMALSALMIFLIMQEMGISERASYIGLAAFLTGGRWASYTAGHPVTDSLTILCIAGMVYGIISQKNRILFASIVIGLISKESFALFFPLLILFSKKNNRLTILTGISFSLLCYFGIKFQIDAISFTSGTASLKEAFDTIESIKLSIGKLFSIKGMADLFSVYGFFSLFLITGLLYGSFRKKIKKQFNLFFLAFTSIILIHLLLSSELARMLFLGSALFVPLLASAAEVHPWFEKIIKGEKAHI